METTYSLQCTHINEMPASSIEDLRMNWPYIFTQRGIYAHFELLTDIKVLFGKFWRFLLRNVDEQLWSTSGPN